MSLRIRLTLLYTGLFLVAGTVLLGTTYVLFDQQLAGMRSSVMLSSGPAPSASAAPRLPDAEQALHEAEAQRRELRDAAGSSLLVQGAIALGVVGAAAAGFGWLVAGRVLAPLQQVTATARRIAAAPAAGRGLHERIELDGPADEVRELANAFDTMLERLDRSFDGQRRFIANASHELRTPLTVGRALVELAVNRRTASADTRKLGEDLLQINERHEQLITGLLLLATSENALTEPRPADLADVAAYVLAQCVEAAEAAGVRLEEDLAEASTSGDALLLERLVHNLVENGIRYNTGPDGWVRVCTRAGADGRVELEVSNTGPVVAPYEVPALFEPFHRRTGERRVTGGGAGLGLSIVRSVAATHSGTAVARPRAGGGLVVTVELPAV
ncbi:MAG TPA: HAMP domain-containing sensor histidine kinase [Dactylosporangium sp.]|nr:HAMP domain-containing sensor histidine kinase [Dactylosporangium sp.]